MKFLACWILMLLPLAVPAADRENLAGETETARPLARPSVEAPEESAPLSLTRRPSVSGPSFKLPEILITGEGEAKALHRRGELKMKLDSSGGIRVSPGEQSDKSQTGAQGVKQDLSSVTYTARSSFGRLTAVFGLADTSLLDLIYGQEQGDFTYSLQARNVLTDGGRLTFTAQPGRADRLFHSERGLSGQGAWQAGDDQRLQADLGAEMRDRSLPFLPLANAELSRSRMNAGLAWQANFPGLFSQNLQLVGRSASLRLDAASASLREDSARLNGEWEKEIATQQGPVNLGATLNLLELWQSPQGPWGIAGRRTLNQGGAGIYLRFEPYRGGRLGLGTRLAWTSDPQVFTLSPLVEWDHRLGAFASLFAVFEPGLDFPQFSQEYFEKDLVLPNPQLKPGKEELNLKAGSRLGFSEKGALTLTGLARQIDDGVVLDDPGHQRLWTPVNAGRLFVWGLKVQAEAEQMGWISQILEYDLKRWQNLDAPDKAVPMEPEHQGRASLRLTWQPVVFQAGLGVISERALDQSGRQMSALVMDLDARFEISLSTNLSLLLEGRNLLARDAAEWPGYAEAAPYVGAGIYLVF